jgi:hypothetical protein
LKTSLLIEVILIVISRIGILRRWKGGSCKFYEKIEKGEISTFGK